MVAVGHYPREARDQDLVASGPRQKNERHP
jgi:hypothetical protein